MPDEHAASMVVPKDALAEAGAWAQSADRRIGACMAESTAVGGLRVVSATAGRVRMQAVDVSGNRRLPSVAEELATWPEVTSVALRARSRSVVVRFDPEEATVVADRLLSLGVDLRAGVAVSPSGAPPVTIAAAAATADRVVGRRFDGTDLRLLVPLGLGLMAVRRAMRGNERLADAPWYVLAWYASETFLRFHGRATAGELAGSEGE